MVVAEVGRGKSDYADGAGVQTTATTSPTGNCLCK